MDDTNLQDEVLGYSQNTDYGLFQWIMMWTVDAFTKHQQLCMNYFSDVQYLRNW